MNQQKIWNYCGDVDCVGTYPAHLPLLKDLAFARDDKCTASHSVYRLSITMRCLPTQTPLSNLAP